MRWWRVFSWQNLEMGRLLALAETKPGICHSFRLYCNSPTPTSGSTKRLASQFYQLKAGHCCTGQYLHWAKNRPDPQCWWCQCPSQTRENLFKVCPKWKMAQKILWAEVRKETGRWKSRWRIRDLFADRR